MKLNTFVLISSIGGDRATTPFLSINLLKYGTKLRTHNNVLVKCDTKNFKTFSINPSNERH